MVNKPLSENLKLILVVVAYGSYHWASVEGVVTPMYGCYICTSNDKGCISSDPVILAPYKKACNKNYPGQCAVTLGQRNSTLYNGYPPRPDDELEGDISFIGSILQRFCSIDSWSTSSFRAGSLVTGRGCSDTDYCNSYLPDIDDDNMKNFIDVKEMLLDAATAKAAADAADQVNAAAKLATNVAKQMAADREDKAVADRVVADKAIEDLVARLEADVVAASSQAISMMRSPPNGRFVNSSCIIALFLFCS